MRMLGKLEEFDDGTKGKVRKGGVNLPAEAADGDLYSTLIPGTNNDALHVHLDGKWMRILLESDLPTLNAGQGQQGSVSFASLTDKPTSLAGYGIVDAIKNAGGVPSIQSGNLADRPAAGIAGRLYVTSDSLDVYRDTGLEWVKLIPQQSGEIISTTWGTIGVMSGTSIIVPSTVAPSNTEGTQVWARQITPQSVDSDVIIRSKFTVDCSSNNRTVIAALFRNNQCIQATNMSASNGQPRLMDLEFVDSPNTNQPVTYSLRFGVSSNATWYINQSVGGTLFGQAGYTNYLLMEVK